MSDASSERFQVSHSGRINWFTQKALPNLRKQAESPWAWASSGFGGGFGVGFVLGAGGKVSWEKLRHIDLSEPFLCALTFGLVFGLFALVLGWRLNRGRSAAEIGAICGCFVPVSVAVIVAFMTRQGWESLDYLKMNSSWIAGASCILAIGGAISSAVIAILLRKTAVMASHREDRAILPCSAWSEADSRNGQKVPVSSETIKRSNPEPDTGSSQATSKSGAQEATDPPRQSNP